MEKSYRVHDMVLDLVCFLLSEENFVTRLHDTEQNSGQIQRQEIQDYPSKRAYGRYDYHQQHASNVVSWSSRVIADPASTYQSRSLGLRGCRRACLRLAATDLSRTRPVLRTCAGCHNKPLELAWNTAAPASACVIPLGDLRLLGHAKQNTGGTCKIHPVGLW